MGFFKNLIFGEEKEKTKLEQQVEEHKADYSCAMHQNDLICNGCGQIIETSPRFIKLNGRQMIFHKRCMKAMQRGELPKPINPGQ